MASLAPPDGWIMLTGTWGTDADRNESTFLSGGSSIELKNTSVATKMAGPFIPVTRDASGNKQYEAAFTVRASNNTGVVTLAVEIYDSSFNLIETVSVHNAAMTAANTWYLLPVAFVVDDATHNYYRFTVAKAASAFTVYIDQAHLRPIAPFFRSLRSDDASDHTIASGSWVEVASYEADDTFRSDASLSGGTWTLGYYRPGVMTARVQWIDSIPDGTVIGIKITDATPTDQAVTQFAVGGAGTHQIGVTHIDLISGSYKVYVYQNSGTDKDATVYFAGIQPGF